MNLRKRLTLLHRVLLAGYAPVGGQAVIEGIMMRSPRRVATAVRRPSGEVVLQEEPFQSVTRRSVWLGIPVIRGMAGLVETLALGLRSLSFSASQAALEDDAPAEEEGLSRWSMAGTMILAFGLGLLLFFYLPLQITEWLGIQGSVAFNLTDGAIRLTFFLLYIWGISRWGEMRRLFEYHGAEHKVIHTFEAGLPLTPEHAKPFPTLHPRCGTSFLLSVMILSVFVFTLFGRPDDLGDRLLRLVGVPVIAGLGFEYIRFSGKHAEHALVNLLAQPGLWLQHITTKEPDTEQLAVACRALEAVLPLSEEDMKDVRVM